MTVPKVMNYKSLLSIFIFCFTFHHCTPNNQKFSPKAIKGELDLRGWELDASGNFASGNTLSLDGEWEFYWQRLLEPSDFRSGLNLKPDSFLQVPGFWNDYAHNGKTVTGNGYASYRLLLKLKPGQIRSIHIYDFGSAYKLFINGKMLLSRGLVGRSENQMIPQYLSGVAEFQTEEVNEILIQISNFHHVLGGPWHPLILGNVEAIRNSREMQIAVELFLCGAILLIGLYHFGLFALRHKDLGALYFGIACLLFTVRVAFTGERFIFHLFPDFPLVIGMRIEFFAYAIIPVALVRFIHHSFPDEFPMGALRIAEVLGFTYAIIVLFGPMRIFTMILLYFWWIFLILYLLYIIYILINAVRKIRIGALGFFIGSIVLLASVFNDILSWLNIIPTPYVLPFGFLIFIFSQAFMLSTRFAYTFLESEKLTFELKIFSEGLEQKVIERTQALNNSLQIIRNDLSIAKKIQENTLYIDHTLIEHLDIFPLYIPMTVVGGDFYDICRLNDNTYRIFLADATGHGVQAAMITMVIKGIYDSIKHYDVDANMLLEIFNNGFVERYRSLSTFLTCILVDIDVQNHKIKFASAGHPPAILMKNDTIHLMEKTGKMIGIQKKNSYTISEFEFQQDDRVYLFTDGIFEEFNNKKEEFGDERLYSILKENAKLSIEENVKIVLDRLEQFLDGREKQDDITILGIEYKKILNSG